MLAHLRTADGNRILFRNGKWCVMSFDGAWILSRHETLESARAWKKSRRLASKPPVSEKNGKYCHVMPDGKEMCHDTKKQADDHVKKIYGMQSASRHLHLLGATGTIRTALFEEREHVVVPVVALVEGVIFPVNAETPELVLAEELAKSPAGWNGRPVLPDHPSDEDGRISANDPVTLETQAFGRVFNARVDGKKLIMEAWLDTARATVVGAQGVLSRVRAGEMIEVSVGAFIVSDETPGVWNGHRYGAIWREIVPDHLAILPEGTIGACSNAMGCGTPRAATVHLVSADKISLYRSAGEGGEDMAVKKGDAQDEPQRSWRDKLPGFFRAAQDEGLSDADLRGILENALRATEPGFLGVDSVFPQDTMVVYAVAPAEGVIMLRRGYQVDATGHVTLSADKEEVVPVTRFEPVVAEAAPKTACGCGAVVKAEGGDMEKKDRVKAIVASGKTPFTEKDIPELEKASDTLLKTLEDQIASVKEPEKKKEPEVVAPVVAPVVAAKEPTEEEFLAKHPHIKAIVDESKARAARRKTELIVAMQATKQEAYSKEELEALPLEQLERIAKLAVPTIAEVDQSGRGLPRAAAGASGDVPKPPSLRDALAKRAERKSA